MDENEMIEQQTSEEAVNNEPMTLDEALAAARADSSRRGKCACGNACYKYRTFSQRCYVSAVAGTESAAYAADADDATADATDGTAGTGG